MKNSVALWLGFVVKDDSLALKEGDYFSRGENGVLSGRFMEE